MKDNTEPERKRKRDCLNCEHFTCFYMFGIGHEYVRRLPIGFCRDCEDPNCDRLIWADGEMDCIGTEFKEREHLSPRILTIREELFTEEELNRVRRQSRRRFRQQLQSLFCEIPTIEDVLRRLFS